MTSPPLSETGPSPEALFEQFLADWKELPNIDMEASAEEDSREIAKTDDLNAWKRVELTRLVEATKRSAHLQDARAGCIQCAQVGPPDYDPKHGSCVWWHGSRGCNRPEVWDALSLLPPKGTK